MSSLAVRMIVATVPLLMLVGTATLVEMLRNHHGRRILKKLVSGALRGVSHGPMFR